MGQYSLLPNNSIKKLDKAVAMADPSPFGVDSVISGGGGAPSNLPQMDPNTAEYAPPPDFAHAYGLEEPQQSTGKKILSGLFHTMVPGLLGAIAGAGDPYSSPLAGFGKGALAGFGNYYDNQAALKQARATQLAKAQTNPLLNTSYNEAVAAYGQDPSQPFSHYLAESTNKNQIMSKPLGMEKLHMIANTDNPLAQQAADTIQQVRDEQGQLRILGGEVTKGVKATPSYHDLHPTGAAGGKAEEQRRKHAQAIAKGLAGFQKELDKIPSGRIQGNLASAQAFLTGTSAASGPIAGMNAYKHMIAGSLAKLSVGRVSQLEYMKILDNVMAKESDTPAERQAKNAATQEFIQNEIAANTTGETQTGEAPGVSGVVGAASPAQGGDDELEQHYQEALTRLESDPNDPMALKVKNYYERQNGI